MKSAFSPQCLISLSSFSSFRPWLVYNLFRYIHKMVYIYLAEADAATRPDQKRTHLNGCIPGNLHFSMFIKQSKCLNPCVCSAVWWVRIADTNTHAHSLRTLQQPMSSIKVTVLELQTHTKLCPRESHQLFSSTGRQHNNSRIFSTDCIQEEDTLEGSSFYKLVCVH